MTKLAHKIDWSKGEDEDEDEVPEIVSVSEKSADEDSTNKKPDVQQSTWPWDGVRTKLLSAYTEMCVLSDVIAISKDKRYMVLDPVQTDQPEQRLLAQLFSKKRVS